MKTQEIKNMGQAYLSVLEAMKKKKMDPVDADELKGDHEDRDDKDIDNDGDTDKSDVYLHNRRKAISKASKNKEVETTESVDVDEAKKMKISAKQIKTALASAKAQAKPKDQVSLKKAPFDIPKESIQWTILNRIMEKAAQQPNNGEKIDALASPKDKEFIKMMGGLDGQDSGIDGAKAAQQTIDNIRASGKVAAKRPGDQDVGDKKIMK